MKHLEGRTPGVVDPSPFTGARVNPVPRTYACLCSGRQVRGFGALPLQGGRNIHPRDYARGVLWYGVKPCAGHFLEVSPFTIVMTDHVYTATKLCTICRAAVSALS